MRKMIAGMIASGTAMILVLAGCSQSHREEPASMDMSESAVSADAVGAPNIAITAAPGVAFNYRYAFRLPTNRINAVQEQHAQACEKLGVTKCRITGMRYSLIDGDDITASLQFKLSPEIARQFGKDGIAAVTAAEGMLVNSEISGIDEGANIKSSQVRSAELNDRLAEIEKQLSQPGLKDAERTQLQSQADSLRQQRQNESQSRSDSEEALANTPMEFHYGSGSSIPGFDGSSPLKESWRAAVSSFMTMLGFVLLVVGVALPWLFLAVLLVALWRAPPVRAIRTWFAGQRIKTNQHSDELTDTHAAPSVKTPDIKVAE